MKTNKKLLATISVFLFSVILPMRALAYDMCQKGRIDCMLVTTLLLFIIYGPFIGLALFILCLVLLLYLRFKGLRLRKTPYIILIALTILSAALMIISFLWRF